MNLMLLSTHHINTSHHHSTTIYSIGYNAWFSSEDCNGYRWRFKAYLVSIERGNQGTIRFIERLGEGASIGVDLRLKLTFQFCSNSVVNSSFRTK